MLEAVTRAYRELFEAGRGTRWPVIVCADMGMGKTTFIEKVNSTGKYRGYDLEVGDIPEIWGKPDADGNMSLVDGWPEMAMQKIMSLRGVDVVAVTSDRKMVETLLERKVPFFLAYKDDVTAIRKAIEKRTAVHFANVVRDFGKYIGASGIPDELKRQMMSCSPEALTDMRCADAIPESIISSDSFQSDDRYRHWHDMFKFRKGGRSVSIMDQNIENLERRIAFFNGIRSGLCTKIPLRGNEYLSSDSVVRTILGRAIGQGSLMEASEGDARKYMKAVLERNGMADALEYHFGPDWPGRAYSLIRDFFVHRGGCDVYYVPGIARLVFSSSDEIDDPDMSYWEDVNDIVKFISIAHKGEFSRNLEHITTVTEGPQRGMRVKGKPMSFTALSEMFSREIENTESEARENFEHANKSPTGYNIIVLDDFETAHEYLKYTPPTSPWCYLQNKETFDDYKSSGNKLYLALAPGFENLKPGDKGYGRSMIGFDMGPVDERGISKMKICNNRYNHDPDLEHENKKSGDSKYTALELSEILGIPVWRDCPGYTEDELIEHGQVSRATLEHMFTSGETLMRVATYEQEAFQEKYGVKVELCQFADMQPLFEFLNQRSLIVCYATIRKNTDDPVFFDMYRRVSGDIFAITDVDKGSKLVTEDGQVLTDEWYSQIGKSDSSGFPVPVARRNANHETEWNLLDEDGTILLDRWYANLSGPYRHKYIIIRDNDSSAKLCDANTGTPIMEPMDNIRHTIVDQTHVFAMEKDKRFNYWADGVFLLDEWTDTPMSYSDLYRLIRKRNGLPL